MDDPIRHEITAELGNGCVVHVHNLCICMPNMGFSNERDDNDKRRAAAPLSVRPYPVFIELANQLLLLLRRGRLGRFYSDEQTIQANAGMAV